MRHSGSPDLLDAVLEETIPMHGRMIHGTKYGELYEESQTYDINGRVSIQEVSDLLKSNRSAVHSRSRSSGPQQAPSG